MPEQAQVSEKEKKEQQALHEQVVKALNEIGADVNAAPQVGVDEKGYLRINAVPFVTKKVNEEPKDDAPGAGKDDKSPSPEAK